ncbi:phosphate ABC transporter substrate-binding protein [[Eubacterium] cellulosolvens]
MNAKYIAAAIVILLVAIGGAYTYMQMEPTSISTSTTTGTPTTTPTTTISGSLTIAGSTTVLPLNQEWARLLMEQYPDLRISVSGGGSGHGVKSVGSDEIDIGAASRDVKQKEFDQYPEIKPVRVAKDSIAIVVHPNNPISEISMEDIAKIYAGEITNFKQIGGPDMDIVVYTREEGSGTRGSFEEIVLDKYDVEILGEAITKPSNGEVRASIAGNEAGFAYLSMGYLDNTIKGLAIDGVDPTVANVKSGDYPVVRNLYLITNGEPSELEKLFIDFALSAEGQSIVEETGYISVS